MEKAKFGPPLPPIFFFFFFGRGGGGVLVSMGALRPKNLGRNAPYLKTLFEQKTEN